MAYELALPPNLQHIHNVFHVSMLRRYHSDVSHIIEYETVKIQPDLSYEEKPVEIVDRKEQVLRNKTISLVRCLMEESTNRRINLGAGDENARAIPVSIFLEDSRTESP